MLSILDDIPGGMEAVENVTVYPDGLLVVTADDIDYEVKWR